MAPRNAYHPPRERDALDESIVELVTSGKLAEMSRRAIEKGLNQGIAVTYQRGNEIIKHYPDGREEVIGIVASAELKIPSNIEVISET